ncbi:MAG: S49 family peptidase [Spirochaetota bacterium]|nr:S49 family peptidase [Spirochaetota bacterium]
MRHWILLLLILFFFCLASAVHTLPSLPASYGAHPWALGLGGGLAAEIGFLDHENFAESLFFAARWKSVAAALAREDDVHHWQFSFGLPGGSSFLGGAALNLFAGDGYTDTTATLGLGYGFSRHFLTELQIRDIVLSRDAGGRVMPQYDLAFYLGAQDALFTLEGFFSLAARGGEYNLGAKLFFRPASGLEFSASLGYAQSELCLGAGIGVALGNIFERAGFSHNKNKNTVSASVVLGDHDHGDLLARENTLLEVVVNASISGQAREGNLLFGQKDSPGFAARLFALYRAAHEPSLKLVVVRLSENSLGYARSEELMEALLALRREGKKIIAVIEKGGLRNLLIASAANEMYMDPNVQLEIAGPAMTVAFYKGFFDKLGIDAEFFARDVYKTAPQSYTEPEMTPAHRESAIHILDRIRDRVFVLIAANRGLTPERVASWCAKGLMTPEEALREGVVTHLGSYAGLGRTLARLSLAPQSLGSFLDLPQGFTANDAIAVVTIEGTIVNGKSRNFSIPFLGKSAGADTIIAALREALLEKRVRGIIIRVESGGGDILASARIREAIISAAKRKPLVISMGDLAASGGFWLACGDAGTRLQIFAGSLSLTGSIGVFAGKVSTEKLRAHLGIASERLGDPNANLYADEKGFTPEQRALINKMLDYWYAQFVDLVAEGRRMPRDKVLKSAGGRVWTGEDAGEFGLVDRNAGLLGAYAALLYGLRGDPLRCDLVEYPKERFDLANLIPTGLGTIMASFSDPDDWPGILGSGRALALLPWNPVFD